MKLQTAAENDSSGAEKIFEFETGEDFILPTDKLFREILIRRLEGEDIKILAKFFHSALAEMISRTCEKIRECEKINTVALSGGVFQNSLLTGLTIAKLKLRGFEILRNKMIPPNDGGLAVGQALHVLAS